LERLECSEVIHELHESTTPYLSHANVKELIFNASTLPRSNLEAIMDGFPKLETFRFGWDFMMMWPGIRGRWPSASVMTEIVMRRNDTIRHLSLDLGSLNSRGDRRLQDLSGMSVLETLHIHGLMLPRKEEDLKRSVLTVSEILPSSIRELGLMGEADKHLWEEVIDLITNSSVKHPHLQRVIVASPDLAKEDSSDWIDMFTSACNEFDIEFSMQEPQHWRALTGPLSHWTDEGKFKQQRYED
jgi:hypothetical protein